MKRIILLALCTPFLTNALEAQKKEQKVTAYAITASQKGHSAWGEVRLIDVLTGEEIRKVYGAEDKVDLLNARTGRPIAKKEVVSELRHVNNDVHMDRAAHARVVYRINERVEPGRPQPDSRLDQAIVEKRIFRRPPPPPPVRTDMPFATNSAACAYDQKHERLYYTPLGINQLRYIDLKAKNPEIRYFEDEAFGVLAGRHDVENQITRMVIASDGNGYALTNSGEHLIKFSTNKKPTITDLGALTDDANNGAISINNGRGYGGDMVADDRGKLYLITANKRVFKIDPSSKVATYLGGIKGLPAYYTTNGAVVEKGNSVIVSSANSTEGYYRFDITTLEAEKIQNTAPVFNASDLANGAFLSGKKTDNKNTEETIASMPLRDIVSQNNISVFPNPVSAGGSIRVAFGDQPVGKYTIQFMDLSGKLIGSREVRVNNKMQTEDYKLPALLAKGNYLVKVVGAENKSISVNTVIVQ